MMRGIICALAVFLGVFLFDRVAISLKNFQAGDIGLGIATTTHENFFDNQQINQTHGEMDKIIASIKYFKNQGNEVVLLLGNSQLHAINYYNSGDFLTVYYLNTLAVSAKSNLRFVQLSSPNINFQELLIYYLSLSSQQVLPDWIVIGATYRGFQLSSIRESFLEELKGIDLRDYSLKGEVIEVLNKVGEDEKLIGSEQSENLQKKCERFLVSLLEEIWEPYKYRGNVRSQLKIIPGMLYQQYINTSTFFSGSEATERINYVFFEQILLLADEDNVSVVIYQPPHPMSEENFQYNSSSYENCFMKLERLCNRFSDTYYKSFEGIVPLEYWGLNNRGRLDVFHFRSKGHQLLAENIYDFFQTNKSKR